MTAATTKRFDAALRNAIGTMLLRHAPRVVLIHRGKDYCAALAKDFAVVKNRIFDHETLIGRPKGPWSKLLGMPADLVREMTAQMSYWDPEFSSQVVVPKEPQILDLSRLTLPEIMHGFMHDVPRLDIEADPMRFMRLLGERISTFGRSAPGVVILIAHDDLTTLVRISDSVVQHYREMPVHLTLPVA